jgi:DNA-directed RNA polymerase subunit M/transcription elongation factor TFIIS
MSSAAAAPVRKKKASNEKQENDVLWHFESAAMEMTEATTVALSALMQATYADVAADSSLSQSSDCEYRKTVRAELFDALLHNAQRQQQHQQSQKKKVRSAVAEEECRKRAAQLERILFDRFFFEDIGRYAERLRSLAHNLRVNGARLFADFDAKTICSLPAHDFARGTDLHQWRAQRSNALLNDMRRRKSTESRAHSSRAESDADGEQGIFRCPKCHGHNTSYVSMQTRSADEPMTNFVTCNTCEIRFKR